MSNSTSSTLEVSLICFEGLSDPRGDNIRHPLSSVLFIALCAVISGAESWEDIELYARSKQEWSGPPHMKLSKPMQCKKN